MTLSNAGNLDITGGNLSFGLVETPAHAGANTISANSTFVPSTDNSRSLGTSALRWNSVWATDGSINTSDERDKSEIKDLDYGIKEIMKLRSAKFKWKDAEAKGDRLGLIAQELQKILPEVVRDWEYRTNEETGAIEKVPSARLAVAYSEIIPVLINGIKEQQVSIEAKQEAITELQLKYDQLDTQFEQLKDLIIRKGLITANELTNPLTASGKAMLGQSVPNPSGGSTELPYFLPDNVTQALIKITSINGTTLRTYPISGRGASQLTINARDLPAGIYIYTLMVNGKSFQSKKMIIAR